MAFPNPETGEIIGEGTGKDAYHELAATFHFPLRSPEETLRYAQRYPEGRSPEWCQRVEMGMLAILKERQSAVHSDPTAGEVD